MGDVLAPEFALGDFLGGERTLPADFEQRTTNRRTVKARGDV
jgi:hypothetical protein